MQKLRQIRKKKKKRPNIRHKAVVHPALQLEPWQEMLKLVTDFRILFSKSG